MLSPSKKRDDCWQKQTSCSDNEKESAVKRIRTVACLLSTCWALATGQEFTIKFATVAPEGTAWVNVMREYDAAIRKESGGRVGFKIYYGGSQGSEQQYLRKVRIGQLQSVGVTGMGIGEVAPSVRVLEAPFLVQSYQETDFLQKEFGPDFEKAFDSGGYVLLGMTEVGFVYVFTKTPINKPDDLKSIKMWTWEGDPVPETAFKLLGLNPIPLGLENVRTSLQTGLVDGFYTSPLAGIGLQWHTQAKYMIDVPLTNAVGAVLLSKKYYDGLPRDIQDIVLRNGRSYMARLTKLSREDNRTSLDVLKKTGITFLKASPQDVQYYMEIGRVSRRQLVGKLYTEEFLNKIENALTGFRKNNKSSP